MTGSSLNPAGLAEKEAKSEAQMRFAFLRPFR